jgi:hypothetical protein
VSEREQADLSEAEGHDSKTLFGPLDVDEPRRVQPYDVVLLVPSTPKSQFICCGQKKNIMIS